MDGKGTGQQYYQEGQGGHFSRAQCNRGLTSVLSEWHVSECQQSAQDMKIELWPRGEKKPAFCDNSPTAPQPSISLFI